MPYADPEKRREAARRSKAKRRLEGYVNSARPEDLRQRGDYVRWRRRATKQVWLDRLGGCCRHCGFAGNLEALDFDHIDSSNKSQEISVILASSDEGFIEAEMSKCQVLCANCHREKTKMETFLKVESYPIEKLQAGDLIEIVWADVLEDPTGHINEARLAHRTSFHMFHSIKPGLGGGPAALVGYNTIDDPETAHLSGWIAYPLGMIIGIRFIRHQSREMMAKKSQRRKVKTPPPPPTSEPTRGNS